MEQDAADTGTPVGNAHAAAPEPVPMPMPMLAGDSRWREMLELDSQLFSQCGVHMLTPEARVLLYLRLEGPVKVSAAMRAAGTSDRGFYAVLERLREAGLVATVRDTGDQRIRRLSLSETAPLAPVRP